MQAIVNGRVFDGESILESKAVLIEGDRIFAIADSRQLPGGIADVYDLRGGMLVPGFIDLQVNGGGGVLFNAAPTVDTLRVMGAAHRQFGTTGFLPTLISDRLEVMREAVAAVNEAMEIKMPGILGIHFEGPFINPERRGAHDAGKFRDLDEEGFALVTSLKRGKTLLTLAPELTGPGMIRRLRAAGVIVCAGHSTASYEQARAALDCGLSGFTHLYNAMTPMLSREPGMVGAALEDENSWFGIIADGHHIHPAAFRVAVAAKNTGGAVLVTDAMPTVGSRSGSFRLNGEQLRVRSGRITNAEGTLAGSDLDMLSAVNNAAAFARIDWFEALRMATVYPARAIGLDGELGAIRPGFRANLLALNQERRVRASWIAGIREDAPPTRWR